MTRYLDLAILALIAAPPALVLIWGARKAAMGLRHPQNGWNAYRGKPVPPWDI